MKSVAHRLGRLTAVALLAVMGLTMGGTSPADLPAATAPAEDAITSLRPEVRLRKLHLVRPDLIQYPLSYDIYC